MRFDRKKFFDGYRAQFGSLSQVCVNNLEKYLAALESDAAWDHLPVPIALRHIAYITATAYHETGHEFEPLDEIGRGRGKRYGEAARLIDSDFRTYYGRGLVQLTWLKNYVRASLFCNVDFVSSPERVKEYPFCYQILAEGSRAGWFTTRCLSDYLNSNQPDYYNARRVINGLDKAEVIAQYARAFEHIFQSALS